ncbi:MULTISPECIES: hypothetical protein [Microbacterium]|uniref:hypothetical protein n=1 Tax=Microbacterium TaxID=33882 RepID=UPI0032ED40EA
MALNIREVVEAQVAEKIEKGEALAHAISAAEEAAAALDAAQKNVAAARRDAMTAGWTETELKRLGLANARPARTRKPRTQSAE